MRPRRTSRNGYNIIEWTSGDLNYRAVSDLNDQELQDFATDAAEDRKITAPILCAPIESPQFIVNARITPTKVSGSMRHGGPVQP